MKFQLFLCLFFFTLACSSSKLKKNMKCQGYDYVYHFGDGLTDIGNSVLVAPVNSIPAAFPPYGKTIPPHTPNGRWSDGLIDFDFATADFGVPDAQPYLRKNFTDAIIFSVARSPVLDRGFFIDRGIIIESFAVSLDEQIGWFKDYLGVICGKSTYCIKERLGNSLVLLGDIEGIDIGYALSQGKSIDEVETYVPIITQKQISVAQELIKMGATKLIIPGNTLIGCYPYVLATRPTDDPSAYDDLGCLKDVTNLVLYKNNYLHQSVNKLKMQYPNLYISYAPYNEGFLRYLQKVAKTENKENMLKSCCGIGGKYNYDPKKFCGSPETTICEDARKYVSWDGIHLTDEASFRIEQDLVQSFLDDFNCTRTPAIASF